MTAPHMIDPGRLLGQALSDASPDLMRHLLGTVVNALLSAEADATDGAESDPDAPPSEGFPSDRSDVGDPLAHEKRGLSHATDSLGMVSGRFQLDPAGGAVFNTAMDHFSGPDPTRGELRPDGSQTVLRDTSSAAQRRADALALIASDSRHTPAWTRTHPPRTHPPRTSASRSSVV